MNCPICKAAPDPGSWISGKDSLFETTSEAFRLAACRICDCRYLDPLPEPERLASFYPTGYWRRSEGAIGLAERLYRRIALSGHVSFIRKVAAALPGERPIRLLDVGCGGGLLAAAMRSRGFHVDGFDVSADAAHAARLDHGLRVHVAGTLAGARLEAGSFDIVTLFHVLEHDPDPRALLSAASRLLSPRGRLILQVPNIASWQARLFGRRWYGLDVPRHVIDYSRKSVVRLLDGCGLRAGHTRHFNVRDNAPAFASSLFPSLDPVRRDVRGRRRGIGENAAAAAIRHGLYAAAVFLAYPFAIAEAAAGAGATLMIEVERK